MSNTTHTPTLTTLNNENGHGIAVNGSSVGAYWSDPEIPAYITRAVNSHARLVEALRECAPTECVADDVGEDGCSHCTARTLLAELDA